MTKIILLTGLFVTCAAAQPPNIIRVVRNANAGMYINARNTNPNAPVTILGMSAVAGLGENWTIEFHDSFGSLEDLDAVLGPIMGISSGPPPQADEFLPAAKALIAVYRTALSYRADQGIQNLPKARFFDIAIY